MKLTIVGLPLGNIEDISLRAIKAIKTTKLILCEDSRVFNKLWLKLQNLGYIDHSYTGEYFILNDFNEKTKVTEAVEKLTETGEGILVSDAGLPTIADPGFVLVNAILEAGGEIDVIPGPTAALTALSISGFSADKVFYLGFLPKKTSKINKNLKLLKPLIGEGVTVILYESPFRLKKTLDLLLSHFDHDTPAVLARELTKSHQTIIRSNLGKLSTLKPVKGEVVLLFRI